MLSWGCNKDTYTECAVCRAVHFLQCYHCEATVYKAAREHAHLGHITCDSTPEKHLRSGSAMVPVGEIEMCACL